MNSSMVMSCMVLSLIEESDERRRSWASERRSTIRPAMHTAMGSDNPAFSKLLRTRVSGVAHAANARRERRKANFFMQAIFQNKAGSQCSPLDFIVNTPAGAARKSLYCRNILGAYGREKRSAGRDS